MFMYSYCYVCSVLGTLFHCVVLCIVCVQMHIVLLPPGVNPVAVNKYMKCFSASPSSSGSLNLMLAKVTKLLK